jgi:hypothetical protein
MPEIIGTFLRAKLWDERANGWIEARNSSRGDLARNSWGYQALLDICEEHLSGHGTLDHHRRGDFIVPQGGYEVIVSHAPSGTVPITLKLGGGPSLQPHHVRADRSLVDKRQPGSRCCVDRETAKATAAGSYPPLAQLCNRLQQSQIGLLCNQSQDLGGELFERRSASAARLRRGAPPLAPALQPLAAELTLTSKRSAASRRDALVSTGFENAFPQVHR